VALRSCGRELHKPTPRCPILSEKTR
jgi:hypothetical protein